MRAETNTIYPVAIHMTAVDMADLQEALQSIITTSNIDIPKYSNVINGLLKALNSFHDIEQEEKNDQNSYS